MDTEKSERELSEEHYLKEYSSIHPHNLQDILEKCNKDIERLLGQKRALQMLLIDAEEVNEEIVSLLRSDKYVEAIKRYREITRTGLYEAKQAVDMLRHKLTRVPSRDVVKLVF